ncbi:phosphoenolpyruvate--protein phosphotransferase [Rhodoblastus acidophilus]|uniref:phosphoenolpyruvate--protein phosphotransferase n=1 Tax=Candidatus Rhodoblastus alkanivorans TaxID=2954117 RepID=A0ABS9Z2G3_9HYPH|nr:phosphoenolpyruvate--protein phosphotransferase [Candidatus Rhodoblastus alkanivorans]MCI4678535.1 phosphoenolpyruvate--protein phosphotransferase [Candidatus Rhodoblastus alkanivorans]MCI4681377.1 phosphoenolpyruvate--protein phosphotransferase [Candidatus Rhodoblastus alkanivorans]MDI4642425.1 phosphoenolpyruvate--protein phosphotransferase [Rhodoblastus acidophilus]
MRGALGGPRLLLRRLREVMAEPVNAQARLDRIVIHIAANMVAEVCSVYVARSDGKLELYATEGLNREAVHLTTMTTGEGLVGLIAEKAEPLALADAQAHPAFSYRPETGEEIYQSFLGVPILRGGNMLGVLVVQNRARRTYSEEEVEALQTTAMLLAEMIASGELQSLAQPGQGFTLQKAMALCGAPLCEGVGLGHVVLHEPRIVVKQLVAEDPQAELRRLEQAIQAMREQIDQLIARGDRYGVGEHRDVLETVRMFANDRGWLRRLREALESGLTAEAAVERVQNDARAKLQRQTDPYLRERLHDLDDIANRLLRQLTGQGPAHGGALPPNSILVARNMGPAALLEYDRANLRGLVLEDGGPTSHVAIIARALGLPAIGEAPNITDLVETGDAIIVDGGSGEVHLRPPPDVEAAYGEKARLRARRQEQYHRLRDTPTVTRDGVEISLHMNAGLLIDCEHASEVGAKSIGLFRTELQFMVAPSFPRLSEQYALYRKVIEATEGRPVTFRTLDIGSDKVLPYMAKVEEENPALGWRAIRIGLDRPGLLRMQLRAMLRAGAGREMRIMFPMVATTCEFAQAKALAERELEFLRRHNYILPVSLDLGVMVEVPSLLWQLDEICAAADFLSVGSNDLTQYIFAADRDNKRVSSRFDTLSPPSLRALKAIVDAGDRHGKPVSLCGEMGGKPLEAIALAAIGYRHLSMTPSAIGPVRAAVLAVDVGAARDFLMPMIDRPDDCRSIRQELHAFAERSGVPL